MSAQRQFLEYLLDRLPQPIYTERVAILRHPAFQAGCRGFEPRLPLHWHNESLCRLTTSRLKTSKRRYGKQGDAVVFGANVFSDNLPRMRANTCLVPRDNLPSGGCEHLPFPLRDNLPPVLPPACLPVQQGGTITTWYTSNRMSIARPSHLAVRRENEKLT